MMSHHFSHNLYMPAAMLLPMMNVATQEQLPFNQLCETLGIAISPEAISRGVIEVRQFEQLFEALIEKSCQRDFDFKFAQQLALNHIGGFVEYIFTSLCPRDILHKIFQYKLLFAPVVDLIIEPYDSTHEKLVYASNDLTPISDKPYYAILLFTLILAFARKIYKLDEFATSVHLKQPKPIYHDDLIKFFMCPIFYEQPQNYAIVESHILDKPFPSHEATLHSTLETFLQTQLASIKKHQTLSLKISAYLYEHYVFNKNNPNHMKTPDIVQTAQYFGFSERQLQRLLQKEHNSFTQLRDEVRHQFAMDLIDKNTPLKHIPDILGFSDYVSFARAFKKVAGMTPKRYRTQR